MKSLTDFTISPESVSKLKTMGITEFFPIQADTYNSIISGKDIVAQASTGSGKTIAFALPVIEQLQSRDLDRLGVKGRAPRVLALAPTRELAKQTATVFNNLVSYGGLTILPVYGGTPYRMQEGILERGVDVVVGAPGRIKDLVERGSLDLSEVRHVVLDEVDRMLDMGFLPDVDEILKYVYQSVDSSDSEERPQTLLFSATMPPWVAKTSKRYLSKENIAHVRLSEEDTTPANINHCAMKVPYHSRPKVLSDLISTHVQTQENGRCIIFCERKAEADALCTHPLMPMDCHVLHGDIPQAKREIVLSRFRDGKYCTLITTDVAARGLDIPEVNLVIQCSPPKDTDSYIHRAGRTGRAGRNGLSICLHTKDEEQLLCKVEYDANITFKQMQRPSLVDIVKANKLSTLTSLKAIPDDVIKVFSESAADIIEEMGAEHALAAALAKMSGRTTSKQTQEASLLSGRDGYTTMEFQYKTQFTPTKSFLYRVIGKKVGEHFGTSISYVKFTKNKESMVFDMNNEAVEEFEKAWVDESRNLIHRLDKLPELEPEESRDGGFRSYSRDRSYQRGGSYMGRKRPFDINWNSRAPGGARRREETMFQDTSF